MVKSKDKGKQPLKEQTDSSSSSSGEDTEDVYKKVALFAQKIPTKELRNKIIEEGFNKYTMSDLGADVPKWLIDDENKHCRRFMLSSQKEIETMKDYFLQSDAIETAKEKSNEKEKLKVKGKKMKKGKGRKKGWGSSLK